MISGGLPYGSNTSAYSSRPSNSAASRSRMASRSGSGPASVSYRSSGTKSSNAPSRPPASSSWLTSSSRYGSEARPSSTSSSSGCAAMSRTVIRKLRTWSAICSANWLRSSAPVCNARSAMSVVSLIDRSSPFKRPSECDLVGVFEVTAYRQSTSQSGHAQPHRPQQPAQIRRGGLALEVRVGGQDDLGDLPGALDRHHVLGLLDHADRGEVAARVPADPALRLLGHVAADLAELDLLLDLDQDVRQSFDVGRVGREQVECDPLRRLRADAREPAELVDQVLDGPFVHVSLGSGPAARSSALAARRRGRPRAGPSPSRAGEPAARAQRPAAEAAR